MTLTRDELIAMSGTPAVGCSSLPPPQPARTLEGSFANVPAGERFGLAVEGGLFTLQGVSGIRLQLGAAPADLLAFTDTFSSIGPLPRPSRLIFRRGVDLP